ncbi:unnamed protein product [Closterium sp. NIES-65]|nr:unnamed protein product [Closterium sp. NIES-65]
MDRLVRLSISFLALLAALDGINGEVSYSQSGLDWGGDCQSGEKQSPINIVMDEAKEVSEPEKFVLEYDSAATTASVINHGYTVHVHSFSEHAVNGLFAAMEAHFVHQHENDNTSLAVVGVMIRLQRHDKNWQNKVPAGVDTNTTIDVPQNFWTEMIDTSMGFWRYSGSLTTPACSEIVEWHVLRKAKFLSVAQAITFMNLIAKQNTERTDNRLPEPLNGRTVTYFTNVS